MFINQGELGKIKRVSLNDHIEAVYNYIVLGHTQDEIDRSMAFPEGQWFTSSIIRAYGFNRQKTDSYRRGKDSGKYRGVDKGIVEAYVRKYYPGIEGDDFMTFDEFIAAQRPSRSNAPKQQAPKAEATRSIPVSRPVFTPPAMEHQRSRAPEREPSYMPHVRKYVILGFLACVLLYYGYTELVKPAFHAVSFNLSIFSQSEVTIRHLTLSDGEYVGEAEKKAADGFGKMSYADGDVFVGQLHKGKRGNYGAALFANGDKYIGGFKNDQYDEFGMLELEDGTVYIGEFKNGMPHGAGAVLNHDMTIKVGNYKEGASASPIASITYPGKEVTILQEGSEYKELAVADGYVVLGKYTDNQLNGYTIELAPEYLYFGRYSDGVPNGYGVKINGDGSIEFGNRKDNQLQNAILYLADGNMTFGTFKDRMKTGYGMEYLQSGELYIGRYKDSERHGKGTYVFANGVIQECTYDNGRLLES